MSIKSSSCQLNLGLKCLLLWSFMRFSPHKHISLLLQLCCGLVQAKVVIRHVPQQPRPGMFCPLLAALTAGIRARTGIKPSFSQPVPVPAQGSPCSGLMATLWDRFPEHLFPLAPHIRSLKLTDCITDSCQSQGVYPASPHQTAVLEELNIHSFCCS